MSYEDEEWLSPEELDAIFESGEPVEIITPKEGIIIRLNTKGCGDPGCEDCITELRQ